MNDMKKLLLLLFSLMLSFNSYGEWVSSAVDANGNIHYLDFENIKKTNGYTYYWEMINYAEPTDEHLSIATYREADCDLHRFKDLTFNAYTQEMAEGVPETIDLTVLKEDWTYPIANTLGDIILSSVCKGDSSIDNSYVEWFEVSTHVDGSTTFYMDPDSIKERDGYLYFWTLTDYASPMEDTPIKILSVVSRRQVSCEEEKMRNEVIINYDDNMGKGEITLLNDSPSTKWMVPPPGSNFSFYILTACGINKLSDEEMEELKIEWRASD
jgi:hypothetical protein